MVFLTRKMLLKCLSQHAFLSSAEIAEKKILGFVPDKNQLKFLLHQLQVRGHILLPDDVMQDGYAITFAGLAELNRLCQIEREPQAI